MGKICLGCGATQVIKDNGNYFLGNDIDVEIDEIIEMCVVCEIVGLPEKQDV